MKEWTKVRSRSNGGLLTAVAWRTATFRAVRGRCRAADADRLTKHDTDNTVLETETMYL
jgi:hypothetical protein